jgi:hypothetical protein
MDAEKKAALDESRPGWFYGLNGEPLSLREWSLLFGDLQAKTIARTEVGRAIVHAIWNGHDFEDPHREPPYIYSCAILIKAKAVEERWASSQEDIRRIHDEMVALARERYSSAP